MQKQVQTYDQVFEARLSESKESVRTRGRIWPNRVRRNRQASRSRVRGVNRDRQSIPTTSYQTRGRISRRRRTLTSFRALALGIISSPTTRFVT